MILTITEQARDVQDAFHRGRGEVVTSAWAALDESDRTALAAATPSLRRLADLLYARWVTSHDALAAAEAVNVRALQAIDAIIDEYELPAHTVGLGVKGCVTWSTTPVRNYRDYKATDFGLAELSWLWGVNRGILTPPGLDGRWPVSLVTTDEDMSTLVEDFRQLAQALRA